MIIYEGESIVLHHEKGDSEFVLITFTGLNCEEVAKEYFSLKHTARKKNLTVFGFATKKPNWFLGKETDDAIETLNSLIDKQKKVIVFGLSMGGYAAIKHSKKLRASCVLSMSPKYSINPEECIIAENYRKYLTDDMENMSLKSGDISENTYILSDPHEKTDFYHTQLILNLSPSAKHIQTFYSDHVVYESLSGSEAMYTLIINAVNGNESDLRRSASTIRRHNSANIRNRFLRSYEKHPILAGIMLISPKIMHLRNVDFIFEHEVKICDLIYKLIFLDKREIALRLYSRLVSNTFAIKSKNGLGEINRRNDLPVVLDIHGNHLFYDFTEKKLTTGNLTSLTKGYFSVICNTIDGKMRPSIMIYGNLFPLVQCGDDVCIENKKESASNFVMFFVYNYNRNYVFLKTRDGMATPLYENKVFMNTSVELDFEKFVLL
ncbi:hypothetical protein [Asaia astilbis]|uniref:hypothetical protein n=1 Tax=Asaia astilbis TaxID=610244 RepID=UPI000471F429|nr:hypothetical protein [Asaia astilbis]